MDATKDIIEKIWEKKSQSYLKYGVLVEIMLSMYGDVKGLEGFDPSVLTKHKNLLSDWKRCNKQHFDHVEKNYPEIYEEYLQIINKIEAFFLADWYAISLEKASDKIGHPTTV